MASVDMASANTAANGPEAHAPVKKYRDLFLPLGSLMKEVTSDIAVFVATPHRRRLRRRERALEDLRLSRQCSLGELASVGLKRVPSAPAFLVSHLLSDDLSTSSSMEEKVSTESGEAEEEEEEESGSEMDEEEELHAGVMRRANELTMMVNLKQLAAKQKLRYGRRRATDVAPDAESKKIDMENRVKTGRAAMDFTELYGRTLEILETNLTIVAPRRRHTWDHWTRGRSDSFCLGDGAPTYRSE